MLRLLVLILLAYLLYRGVASLLGELRGAKGGGTIQPPPPRVPRMTVTVHREPRENTEELVACARCGVRVPKSRMMAGVGGEVVCAGCGKLPR